MRHNDLIEYPSLRGETTKGTIRDARHYMYIGTHPHHIQNPEYPVG